MKFKTRFVSLAVWLIALFVLACLWHIDFSRQTDAKGNAARADDVTVRTSNVGGALEIEADTLIYGDIKVYLPDDMAAGDTISGTVLAEPKGATEDERTKNRDSLEGYVVEIGDQKVTASRGSLKWKIPIGAANQDYSSQVIKILDASGKELANTTIPVLSVITQSDQRPHVITGNDFMIPNIGQQGRAVEIFGPFDGDAANTTVRFGPPGSKAPDFEKNTENVSGGFGLIRPLAESPRKVVFRAPTNVAGPRELMVSEGGVSATGPYRNIRVGLSAPKTNLMRGEKTTVTVEVRGLEGLRTDVPLQLDSKGVITMEGGSFQNLRIKPSEVTPDGRYTTNRAITGVQPGGFNVTATVIVRPFDLCLQDDSDPNRLFYWNSFTGDYVFACGGGSCRGGGTSSQPPTGSSAPPPPVTLTGTGKPTMKGCIITLSHNAPDRRVFARLDACTKTGDASVETTSPKANFNITDKNTTDNTVASPPPK